MSLSGIINGTLNRHPRARLALKRAVEAVRFVWRHAAMFLMGALLGVEDKVVFCSFWGKAYNDNPRYVSEALHALAPEVGQVWLFDRQAMHSAAAPDYVRRVRAFSWEAFRQMATARAWVDNLNQSQTLLLRSDRQVYFNTWHGDRGFKRVGLDNPHGLYRSYMERRCAGMIAGSRFGARTYRTAFDYRGTILMDGCPRNDVLLRGDPADVAALRARMGLPGDARLLIYAPTYRDTALRSNQPAVLDIPRTLDCLQAATGEKWLCLLRTHVLSGGLARTEADARVIDVTKWPEMAELMRVSDMLITDYSSCAGDFILQDKPAILYQPDIGEYLSGSRELYFDVAEAPFFLARDMDALEAILRGLSQETIVENCRAWREYFDVTETGHAAEASARFILKAMAERKAGAGKHRD